MIEERIHPLGTGYDVRDRNGVALDRERTVGTAPCAFAAGQAFPAVDPVFPVDAVESTWAGGDAGAAEKAPVTDEDQLGLRLSGFRAVTPPA